PTSSKALVLGPNHSSPQNPFHQPSIAMSTAKELSLTQKSEEAETRIKINCLIRPPNIEIFTSPIINIKLTGISSDEEAYKHTFRVHKALLECMSHELKEYIKLNVRTYGNDNNLTMNGVSLITFANFVK